MFLSILFLSIGFEDLVQYVGVLLSMFAILVVLGIPILRRKENNEKDIYKAPFGNIISIVFSIINLCMIYYLIVGDLTNPEINFWQSKLFYILITVIPGYFVYLFVRE